MARPVNSSDVMDRFKDGWDTYDMAQSFGLPESAVYHLLARARKNDPDKIGAAIAAKCKQIMADKWKRSGLPIPEIYRVEEPCAVVRVNTGKKTENRGAVQTDPVGR